jgi:sulfur carrier protein ThiS
MQRLTVNGERREFPNGVPANLEDLVLGLAVKNSAIVAEVDGVVINQTVELIRFVGGGSENIV